MLHPLRVFHQSQPRRYPALCRQNDLTGHINCRKQCGWLEMRDARGSAWINDQRHIAAAYETAFIMNTALDVDESGWR